LPFPARIVLRRFGYRLFAAAAGDTLQDWARRLLVCCAHPHPHSATDATHLLLLLLRACFVATGTLSPLATVLTAVFDDVLALVLDAAAARGHPPKTFADEEALLAPLQAAIGALRVAAGHRVVAALGSGTAHSHATPQGVDGGDRGGGGAAFGCAVDGLASKLQTLFHAAQCLRRHATHPVVFDWGGGGNALDGPFDDRLLSLLHNARRARKAATPPHALAVATATSPTAPAATAAAYRHYLTTDVETVPEAFLAAAAVFDPRALPRQHMHWLENLARYQDGRGHRGEGAMARWAIFKVNEARLRAASAPSFPFPT
jgi:hypothetical protein